MTTKCKVLCASLLLLAFCSGAPSDDKAPEKKAIAVGKAPDKNVKAADKAPDKNAKAADKTPDKEADAGDETPDKNAEPVIKALAALEKAYNARDPEAIAELFTPQGEFIDADSNVFDSHETIAGEFKALFEINPKNTIELGAEEIREISPGVLSIDCVARFAGADKADPDAADEPDDIDFSALLIKQADGNWLLASIRSEGEGELRSPHARLKQLEWLVGEWIDESGDSTMHTNTRWSEDGNFLMTDFAIHVAGRKVMSGTQRIGWDGALDKFRSWVFDSEGGHAEGIWTELEDRWIVKVTGVRPDGDACSATNIYEPQGPEAYQFSVIDRIVGDESEDDFTALVVKKPPEPETASAAASSALPRDK
jgi:uncharacterized protein (TIGR02246 family)